MESKEQTELTRKMRTDSYIESRMTVGGREGDRGIEQKGKRTHTGQQCGGCWGVGVIGGLNVNGEKYNKD